MIAETLFGYLTILRFLQACIYQRHYLYRVENWVVGKTSWEYLLSTSST